MAEAVAYRSYRDLLEKLRDRRKAIGMSQTEADLRGGFTEGQIRK